MWSKIEQIRAFLMSDYIISNNKLILKKNAKISIIDRSIKFSDGIFETSRICSGIIYNFESHLNRMKSGLKYMRMDYDIFNIPQLSYELIEKNEIKEGILRISIHRSGASAGYMPLSNEYLLIIEANDRIEVKDDINLMISSYKNNLSEYVKSSSNIHYILTKIEANDNGFYDGILLNDSGNICETSSANIFWVKKSRIFTSSEKSGILCGTIRKKIIELFPDITEKIANIDELHDSDEVFITNSNILVSSVNKIDEIFQRKSTDISDIVKNKIENNIRQCIINSS